jgi:hypothetical protein
MRYKVIVRKGKDGRAGRWRGAGTYSWFAGAVSQAKFWLSQHAADDAKIRAEWEAPDGTRGSVQVWSLANGDDRDAMRYAFARSAGKVTARWYARKGA